MSAARRQFLILEAREWLGTPFAWGQRVKGEGVDCIQLVIAAGLGSGALAEDPTRAYPAPVELRRTDTLLKIIEPYVDLVEPGSERPGDIGYYRTQRNFPIHFGILTDRGIIHTSHKAGRVVETRVPPELRYRLISHFKFKGL